MERLLNIAEVADMLGVEESTLYGWTHLKAIPHIRLGRLLRFRESEINEWLQSKAVTPGIPRHSATKPKGKAARVHCGSDYIDRLVEKAKKEALE